MVVTIIEIGESLLGRAVADNDRVFLDIAVSDTDDTERELMALAVDTDGMGLGCSAAGTDVRFLFGVTVGDLPTMCIFAFRSLMRCSRFNCIFLTWIMESLQILQTFLMWFGMVIAVIL